MRTVWNATEGWSRVLAAVAAVVAAPLAACGSDDAASPTAITAPTETEPQTFADQVTAGQKVYGASCAGCHGSAGEGTSQAPRLVGLEKGALPLSPPPSATVRKTQFKTAADVAAFLVAYMPADKPGSLATWEYYSVLAFALKANGVTVDQKLDATVAATVVLHP